MRWVGLLIVLLIVNTGEPPLANDALHTLMFMEGRYTGGVSIEPTLERAHTPMARRAPASVIVQRIPDGLLVRWDVVSEGYAAAIVGTIGPSTYRAPEQFWGIDWECRPGEIPPFRPDVNAIVVKLLCFIPGQLHRPPIARLEIGNMVDRSSGHVTDKLIFELREMSGHQENRVVRHYYGLLTRKSD